MMQDNQTLLEKYLSKSRLKTYTQIAQNNDFEKALEIYRLNIKYSEKFYSPLTQLEVILRNAINEQLILDFGADWYHKENINLVTAQREMVDEVILKLLNKSKDINSCNIISNLTFGFWVNLFNSDYDKTLWRQSLYKIFEKNDKDLSRSTIRERLEKFRNLRNRISHCEPIIMEIPLAKYYIQLIDFVSWIDKDLSIWLYEEIDFNSIPNKKYANKKYD